MSARCLKRLRNLFNFYVYNFQRSCSGNAVQELFFGLIRSTIVTLTAITLYPWGRLYCIYNIWTDHVRSYSLKGLNLINQMSVVSEMIGTSRKANPIPGVIHTFFYEDSSFLPGDVLSAANILGAVAVSIIIDLQPVWDLDSL